MNYILFDDNSWEHLLPLTYTRPIAEVRVGILTIKQKWEKYLKTTTSYKTRDYLQKKFPIVMGNDNVLINASILPTAELISEIENLEQGQVLKNGDVICAFRTDKLGVESFDYNISDTGKEVQVISEYESITRPWEIFLKNGDAIISDFKLLTKGRKSQSLSKTNTVIGDNEVFVERGAVVEASVLNTKNGPIYIGKNSEVMENAVIRGPFALCEHSAVKMSAKIYGPTTVGPHSKVGGELNNVVIFGYSNKGHDGFLGNAVLGEWCNLGADTNNSNLKNNYAEVKVWSLVEERFVKTGLQFCGLIMGDHSKTGINTMLNTGTVVGVSANIFGDGFPRNFVPSFAWGGAAGFTEMKLRTSVEVAERVFERRGVEFDDIEKEILETVFNMTAKYRKNFS